MLIEVKWNSRLASVWQNFRWKSVTSTMSNFWQKPVTINTPFLLYLPKLHCWSAEPAKFQVRRLYYHSRPTKCSSLSNIHKLSSMKPRRKSVSLHSTFPTNYQEFSVLAGSMSQFTSSIHWFSWILVWPFSFLVIKIFLMFCTTVWFFFPNNLWCWSWFYRLLKVWIEL